MSRGSSSCRWVAGGVHDDSVDVIHSFWVPEFGQKMDAVPGIDDHDPRDADPNR